MVRIYLLKNIPVEHCYSLKITQLFRKTRYGELNVLT